LLKGLFTVAAGEKLNSGDECAEMLAPVLLTLPNPPNDAP